MAVPQGMVANGVAGSDPIPVTVNGTERARFTATGLHVHAGTPTTVADLLHIYDGGVDSNPRIRIQNDVQTWQFGILSAGSDGLVFRDVTNNYNPIRFSPGSTGTELIFQDSGGALVHEIDARVGGVVMWNDQGDDIDYRIEGDTFPNIFRVDAALDEVFLHGRASDGGAVRYAEATTTLDLSVSATATNLIPAGATVKGVLTRIKTAIVFSDSHTTWEVGDGSDTNLWGSSTTLTAGTALGVTNFTAAGAAAKFYPAANNVVITPTGGAGGFTSGEVDVVVKYETLVNLAAAI